MTRRHATEVRDLVVEMLRGSVLATCRNKNCSSRKFHQCRTGDMGCLHCDVCGELLHPNGPPGHPPVTAAPIAYPEQDAVLITVDGGRGGTFICTITRVED